MDRCPCARRSTTERSPRSRIDTLELICAAWSPEIDSVEIAVQFNQTDPLTAIPLMREALSGNYQHYIVTGLGSVPVSKFGPSFANFFIRTHGTDVWLLFREMRVVASPDETASIMEARDENVFILPNNGGVSITARNPVAVSICDASGRIRYSNSTIRGTTFVPLADGLSIVRAGTTVRRIVR